MPSVTVTRRVDERPGAVWDRIGDFGRPGWLPGVRLIEVVGEGPGARRVLGVPRDGRIVDESRRDGAETLLAAR